jgi:hypothetical protein
MRRDGSTTAQTVQTQPSTSAEECTAHPNSIPRQRDLPVPALQQARGGVRVQPDTAERRRRRWPGRESRTRIGGQDKSTDVGRGAYGWFERGISSAASKGLLSALTNCSETPRLRATPPVPAAFGGKNFGFCAPSVPQIAHPHSRHPRPWDLFSIQISRLWRRGWDSNPRCPHRHAAFRVRCFRPLSHLSGKGRDARRRGGHLMGEALARKRRADYGKPPARLSEEIGALPIFSPIQRPAATRPSTSSPVSNPAR